MLIGGFSFLNNSWILISSRHSLKDPWLTWAVTAMVPSRFRPGWSDIFKFARGGLAPQMKPLVHTARLENRRDYACAMRPLFTSWLQKSLPFPAYKDQTKGISASAVFAPVFRCGELFWCVVSCLCSQFVAFLSRISGCFHCVNFSALDRFLCCLLLQFHLVCSTKYQNDLLFFPLLSSLFLSPLSFLQVNVSPPHSLSRNGR